MTYTSTMAQAWMEARLNSFTMTNEETALDALYIASIQDLNRLMEFSLIDHDEYEYTLTNLQQARKEQTAFLRETESA